MFTNHTVKSTRESISASSRNFKRGRIIAVRPNAQVLISLLLTLCTLSSSLGQGMLKDEPDKNPIVTASVTADGVRISAPSEVVQLRLQVYNDAGQKLFDTQKRGGNVFDWHLQGMAGERVADGAYLLVVRVKNPSGQSVRKLGLVTVSGPSTTLRAGVPELSVQQAQVVGPLPGEDEALAVMPGENAQPVSVLSHNGDDAQLTRSRGALSFGIGDFFSGKENEQMRLTEDGRLGIGTSDPKANLDVAGTIRAERVVLTKPGNGVPGANTSEALNAAPEQSLASGSGTQDRIAKWTDNAGTLGDSAITESAGNVGIGTTTPTQALEIANGRVATTGNQTLPASAGVFEIGTTVTNNQIGASGLRMRNLYNGSANIQQALDVAPTFAPAANISLARGFVSAAFFAPPAGVTIGDAYGGNAANIYSNTGGAVTNGTAFALNSPVALGALKPSNQYGLRINNQGLAGTTNSYGLYVDPQAGSTNNYSAVFAGGNVGIGTTTPNAKLEVAGNLKLSGANSSLIFPDGTSMTTAPSGGAMSGTAIVNALNDPSSLGQISDARLSANLPRLNSANTFAGNQTVNANVTASGNIVAGGRVESTSGGFKFPDGSTQTSAAGKTYTTFPLSDPDIEIGQPASGSVQILHLNLPPGSYMVTATVQFENRGLFNKRLVACQIVDEANWFFRIEGSGGAMDWMPITMHTVITHGGDIKLYCSATDGGRSNIFARARRFTAIRLGDVVVQP